MLAHMKRNAGPHETESTIVPPDKARNEMMLTVIYLPLFLTHVGHVATLRNNQRRFAPTLAHITGIRTNLVKTLDNLRRTRNNFAHYPVEFIPRGPAGEQTLDIFLTTHKTQIKIDQEFLNRTDKLFQEASEGLNVVTEAMRADLNRAQ
jgi:hypothetical protein